MPDIPEHRYRLFCTSIMTSFVSFAMFETTDLFWRATGGMERGNLRSLGVWACGGAFLSLLALPLSFFGEGWKRNIAIATNVLLFIGWQPLFHWLWPKHNPQ